MEGSEAAGRD